MSKECYRKKTGVYYFVSVTCYYFKVLLHSFSSCDLSGSDGVEDHEDNAEDEAVLAKK